MESARLEIREDERRMAIQILSNFPKGSQPQMNADIYFVAGK
jgi:hypothetical protein